MVTTGGTSGIVHPPSGCMVARTMSLAPIVDDADGEEVCKGILFFWDFDAFFYLDPCYFVEVWLSFY